MICKTCMKFQISMTLLRFHQDVGTGTHIVCGYCPTVQQLKWISTTETMQLGEPKKLTFCLSVEENVDNL